MRKRALAIATALSIALTPVAAFTAPAVAKTKPPTHHATVKGHHAKKHATKRHVVKQHKKTAKKHATKRHVTKQHKKTAKKHAKKTKTRRK